MEGRLYDRCTGVSSRLHVFTNFSIYGDVLAAPGVSENGSVIAFAAPVDDEESNFMRIIVFRNGVEEFSIDSPDGAAEIRAVSISDDGSVIAFSTNAGPFSADSHVWVYDRRGSGLEQLSGNGSGASVSGDGTLVAYRESGGVRVRDLSRGVTRLVGERGFEARISQDGRYVVYRIETSDCEAALLLIVRSSNRWETATEPEVLNYPAADADPGVCQHGYNAAVSAHGRWTAWSDQSVADTVEGLAPGEYPFQIVVRERRPVLSVSSIDFGTVSQASSRQATVSNVGPSGWRVTSIAALGGAFAVTGEDCGVVLHPGDSCQVTVRYSPSGEGQQIGQLVVGDDSYPGVALSASGRLVGVSDPDVPGLDVNPDPVVFDDTPVGSPAPLRTATVSNTGEVPVTVESLAVAGVAAADFTIVIDSCTQQTLSVGSACDLQIEFAPSDAGARTASLDVAGSAGASASVVLEGSGRFEPMLRVTPEVSSGGEVVSVTGSGYPASTSIEVVFGGSTVAVTSDGEGGFALPWLLLTGTPQGVLFADDVAEVGRFDADPAPLIVVGSPVRPQATAALARSGRRYVSR